MNSDIQKAFHEAVKKNDVETARRMIAAGADVNLFSTNEHPPLVVATNHEDTSMLQLLLENGAQPNSCSDFKVSALVNAASDGKLDMVCLLLNAGADPNYAPDCSYSALMAAVCWGNNEVAERLIQAGANPHSLEILCNDSALINAAEGNNLQGVNILLSCKVDVNHVNYDGETALTYAVYNGNREMVAVLLQAGANPNIAECLLGTPASIALEDKAFHIVELLIRADGRFRYDEEYYSSEILTRFDTTSLFYNMKHNGIPFRTDDEAVVLYAKHACSYLLRKALEAGANPNATDNTGKSALAWALEHPHHPQGCAARLIRNGATFTPELLIYAIRHRMRELVAALLKTGADVNVQDERGNTALHYATRKNAAFLVRDLITAGADIEIRNKADYTPLMQTIRFRCFRAASALLEHGADRTARGGKHNERIHAMCQRYHCRIDHNSLINVPFTGKES